MDGMLGTSILLIVIIALIGFIVGAVACYLFMRGDQQEEEKETAGDLPAIPTPNPLEATHFEELQVWREKNGKALLVKMEGIAASEPAQLVPEQRERFEQALHDMRLWIQPGASAFDPYIPVEKSLPVADPASPLFMEEGNDLWAQEPVAESAISATQEILEEPAPASMGVRSIVQQIDDVLQTLVAESPLQERGVRLVEDMQHGVTVWVGLEKYNGLDAVPYPEVHTIVRRAVEIWEQKGESKIG